MLKSGLGTICEVKPLVLGAVGAVQLTLPKPPNYKQEIYAGFFTFASASDMDKAIAELKATKEGASRKPSILLTNTKALLLVIVNGEIAPADEARFRKVIDGL